MTEQLVTYAVDGRVGIVTLNRPDKLNAISADLKRALVERFHEADGDAATSVVVLRAEGRSFCAGYDIAPNPDRAARRHDALAWHESLTEDIALEMTPWDMVKPVIASVQGHCLGGGCELAMLCDLTIAADDAVFGEPEIRFSNVGPALVMPFVIGLKRARELLYFGDTIDAPTALQYGMVNRVVPRADLAASHPQVRPPVGAHLPRGARGYQARYQPGRRGCRIAQRHPRRPRRGGAALRGPHRGRAEVRRDQRERRAGRCPALEGRPVRRVGAGESRSGPAA